MARRTAGLDLERAFPADRPRVDGVAGTAVHRDGLARDRLLIHARPSPGHKAVDRDGIAGPNQDAVARTNLPRGDSLGGSVGRDSFGVLGCHLEKAADRPPGALQAERLERLGKPEEEGHGGRLVPLPQHDRTQDGQRHEHIDVHPEAADTLKRAGTEPDAPATHRGGETTLDQPPQGLLIKSEHPARPDCHQADRQHQPGTEGRGPAPVARPPVRLRGSRRRRLSGQLRVHTRLLANPPQEQGWIGHTGLIIHGHQPVDQVKSQAVDAGQALQRARRIPISLGQSSPCTLRVHRAWLIGFALCIPHARHRLPPVESASGFTAHPGCGSPLALTSGFAIIELVGSRVNPTLLTPVLFKCFPCPPISACQGDW